MLLSESRTSSKCMPKACLPRRNSLDSPSRLTSQAMWSPCPLATSDSAAAVGALKLGFLHPTDSNTKLSTLDHSSTHQQWTMCVSKLGAASPLLGRTEFSFPVATTLYWPPPAFLVAPPLPTFRPRREEASLACPSTEPDSRIPDPIKQCTNGDN